MNEFPLTGRQENIVRRTTLMAMLRAALESGDLRFARQAAINWLAAYPGDLEVSLLQTRGILLEGGPTQAVPRLDQLTCKDPLSQEVYSLMIQATQFVDPERCSRAQTALYALNGLVMTGIRLEAWGNPLRLAIEALEERRYAEAESFVHQTNQIDPNLLLAAVVHLLIDRATHEALSINHLVQLYHSRWPDCILFRLVEAETLMELGNEAEAVRLLHLCVAKDSTGIVARRLWGDAHTYRSLWPEEMVIHFDLPVPAGVAARMGWNTLAAGEVPPATEAFLPETAWGAPEDDGAGSVVVEASADIPPTPEPVIPPVPDAPVDPELSPQPVMIDDLPKPTAPEKAPEPASAAETENTVQAVEAEEPVPPVPQTPPNPPVKEARPAATKKPASEAAEALESLAKKLKQPGAARMDGRFPVYVIFSSKEGLTRQYGPRTTEVLDGELRRLAGLIRQRKGWGAAVYFPDDAASASQCGLLPMPGNDPWKLKNALAELDAALGKRGERIGSLLIIGGDPVVPMHRLPNPTDDVDTDVLSDSPYATLDSNYFVPEWPVGRLPGERGPDAGLLLEQIRQLQRFHARRGRPAFGFNLVALFRRLFEPLLPKKPRQSFGYTAAVWRRSSLAVFRPIGAPHTVLTSPPDHSGSLDRERITSANLAYYNLHGLEDGPAWYGQRDPLEPAGADYPVALSPEDLHRNGHAPRIVFSEACYGGHVLGKCEKDSLALKFLSMGTLGVVASTCVAYGSVNTPLVAADFLSSRFWQHLKAGRPAGDALMQAKIDLVREMERRQGFLDGEDQKTLISFVLYGDPLADFDGFHTQSKAAPRPKDHPTVKTVCDRADEETAHVSVPPEMLKQVKGLLAEYLPGADLAELHVSRQHAGCDGKHHHCPTSELNPRKKNAGRGALNGSGRLVVTATKQVEISHHLHRHYVRMTLDETGKPVKVAISR